MDRSPHEMSLPNSFRNRLLHCINAQAFSFHPHLLNRSQRRRTPSIRPDLVSDLKLLNCVPARVRECNFLFDLKSVRQFGTFKTMGSEIVLGLIFIFSFATYLSPVFGDQDHVSQEDLLTSLLGDDDSPPLSAEGGVTILGTGAVDPATTLDCHRRLYSYRVTKTDSAGRTCWDNVNVRSCWGRCDSNEIPDWRFPYKRSHHPVCTYGSRSERTVILRNCQPGIEPGTDTYTFQEAESCICTTCKSSEASCEGLRYRGVRSGFRSA